MSPQAPVPPALDVLHPLAPAQLEAYRRDGHILLRGVASPEEVRAYRPVIGAAVDRFKADAPPMEERDTYGKAFLQIMNLWRSDPACARFTLARRFAGIAAALMGVPSVRIYHDQALFKEPGGGHTPWHQDQFYWPLDTDLTITMWMPMVDVTEEMGSMQFASGSQRAGYIGKLAISDKSEELFRRLVTDQGYAVAGNGAMRAGDASFHSGWTLHRAPGNATDRMREAMTVIYYPDGTRVGAVDHPNRENDLKGWLPGLTTGDLAATELNPVVYP